MYKIKFDKAVMYRAKDYLMSGIKQANLAGVMIYSLTMAKSDKTFSIGYRSCACT